MHSAQTETLSLTWSAALVTVSRLCSHVLVHTDTTHPALFFWGQQQSFAQTECLMCQAVVFPWVTWRSSSG